VSIYETLQLAVAAFVLALSIAAGNRRGALWVVAIVVNLMLSTAAWVVHVPYAAAVVAVLDFSLCVLIYQFGRNRWEQWMFLLYQFSMLVSILYLATMVWAPGYVDHDLYSTILEGVNYFSFLLIGTISGIQITSHDRDRFAFRTWPRIRALVLPALRDEA
jgi:hypothetical protein